MPGLQSTVLLCPSNHGLCHPVLDTTGRVLPLELDQDVAAGVRRHLAKPHHGRIADSTKDVHLRPSSLSSGHITTAWRRTRSVTILLLETEAPPGPCSERRAALHDSNT